MKKYIFLFLLIMLSVCISGCICTDSNSETELENIATVKLIHAEMAKGNFDVFIENLTENYVRHCQAMPPELQEMTDKKLLQAFVKDFMGSVSDFNETIDVIMATDDKVAYVTTMTGVQSGPMGPMPASGKEFKVVNIIIHRFEDGKIAESWVSWDNVAMLTQLGFFPPPPQG